LTVSGAMVPAGMRAIISDLIRRGDVDVLVITGANLVHDIIESFSGHCLGSPESDDAALRAEGKSRIYDVFLRDEDFAGFEELMQSILPEMISRYPEEICFALSEDRLRTEAPSCALPMI